MKVELMRGTIQNIKQGCLEGLSFGSVSYIEKNDLLTKS